MAISTPSRLSLGLAVSFAALLAGCEGFDLDLRSGLGQSLDTSQAALNATADRPEPDNRGVISYPNYQVAVARRGDTVEDVAQRVGLDAGELAEYNAVLPGDKLRNGEVLALPRRVSEPSAATGGRGQIIPPSSVDIASLAGSAIDNASPSVATERLAPAKTSVPENAQIGYEPIRHTVQRGETAFTIARLYNVSVRSLAEWNGLGNDFTIRENQILLIPPTQITATGQQPAPAPVTAPGEGSPTPTPPSASQPLPKDDTTVVVETPPAPQLEQSAPAATPTDMAFPVDGKIIRPYSKGKNNGIDLSAPAGTAVTAAKKGTVAAITTDADDVTIVVIRHTDNIMTVYYNVEDVSVAKGSSVGRGEKIAEIPSENNYLHFEVRKGFDIVDPMPFLE